MLGWCVVHTCHTVKFFMFSFWVPLLLHCWQRDFAAYSYLCIISENALGSDFYWRAGAHLLLPLPGVVRGGILDRFRTQIFVNCGNTHDWSSGISKVYGYRLRIGHSHSPHSHNAIFYWNFQKYSVKIIYAIIGWVSRISKKLHYGILINMPYWEHIYL